MRITWDLIKAEENIEKHGVSFDEAVTVLLSDDALRFEDDHHDEDRFISIGYSTEARVLMVVYKATRKEREQYEKGI